MWVTYRFSYAMPFSVTLAGGGGWGMGTINNEVLKFRKIIEFESSCIVICFSYIYLIIAGKEHLSIKDKMKAYFCYLVRRYRLWLWLVYFIYFKFGSRKIPARKTPTHQTSPCKIPPRKIPTWNITTHSINCLSSLNTVSINGERVYMYILLPGRKI